VRPNAGNDLANCKHSPGEEKAAEEKVSDTNGVVPCFAGSNENLIKSRCAHVQKVFEKNYVTESSRRVLWDNVCWFVVRLDPGDCQPPDSLAY